MRGVDSVQMAHPPILWFLNHGEFQRKKSAARSRRRRRLPEQPRERAEGAREKGCASVPSAFLLLCSCCLLLSLLIKLVYILYTDGKSWPLGWRQPKPEVFIFFCKGWGCGGGESAKKASGKLELCENICLCLFKVRLSLTDGPRLTRDSLAPTPQQRSRGRI